jgi:SAM-dependent methyltransferase
LLNLTRNAVGLADMTTGLVELGQLLKALGYRFSTVTPFTQRLVNARPGAELATNLRDVFGWNRRFHPEILPSRVVDLAIAADACRPVSGAATWQPTVRFSTLDDLIFAHSPFPTTEERATFFGPDSVRFAAVIRRHAPSAKRVVDVGAGAGVGGIVLSRDGAPSVVLADVNPDALRFARANAALAGVQVEIVESDVLAGVQGDIDLVVSNPPFMLDPKARVYRDGGGSYGEALAVRILEEALTRLGRGRSGGSLLLYTGAAIVNGEDVLFRSLRPVLARAEVSRFRYEEIDPDIFSDELEQPAYADVERIAAVFLKVRVEGTPSAPLRS